LPDGERFSLASPLVALGDGGAGFWVEALEPNPDVALLATYRDGPWAGLAALTEHVLERGRALYVGWYPSQAQAETILRRVLPMQGLPLERELPPGLVLCRRGPYTILLNFTDRALTASVAGEHVEIAGRDVVVLQLPDKEPE
jgi:beta-galactosidase GanA